MPITDLSTTTIPITTKSVLFFWASWHEPSIPGGSYDTFYRTLSNAVTSEKVYPNDCITFYRVEAEPCIELSKRYNITMVPTFVLLDRDGTIVDTLEAGEDEDMARVTNAVRMLRSRGVKPDGYHPSWYTPPTAPTPSQITKKETNEYSNESSSSLNERISKLIYSSELMLFMKGSPSNPQCGFSTQMVQLLNDNKLSFESFDILTDEDVRQGLKKYSDWPTYPQLYAKGKLMGGLDIVRDMNEDGTLTKQLGIANHDTPLATRLKHLVNQSHIMLFMKGTPFSPRCGFSNQICAILNDTCKAGNITYDTFDILTDEEVRQGLKKYSDWPTYPQLYVKGELIGGLDIVIDMNDTGELREILAG